MEKSDKSLTMKRQLGRFRVDLFGQNWAIFGCRLLLDCGVVIIYCWGCVWLWRCSPWALIIGGRLAARFRSRGWRSRRSSDSDSPGSATCCREPAIAGKIIQAVARNTREQTNRFSIGSRSGAFNCTSELLFPTLTFFPFSFFTFFSNLFNFSYLNFIFITLLFILCILLMFSF